MNEFEVKLRKSIVGISDWVEANNYKGYEPFEGNSSFFQPLTFGNLFAQRVLQQFVLRFPFNIRPLLGISKKESTKGRGYMVKGYLRMLEITKEERYKKLITENLEWLKKNKAKEFEDYSWGNHFNFTSRGGKLPKDRPIIVWTSLIGQAYLDAYELFGDQDYLNVAKSICQWILEVPRKVTPTGNCLSYIAKYDSYIHNSNMLGAAMLARTYKITRDQEYYDVAKSAMEYSCTRQEKDGSWFYGEEEKYHWIDNFHTGYNLDSLKCYIDNTGDTSYQQNLNDGLKYFKNELFVDGTIPKYYHNSLYPIDSQCVGQAIETFAYFSDSDPESLEFAQRVSNWAIDNMQDHTGYFYYRVLKYMKVKTPMLHWAQGTIYSGLTLLLKKLLIKN